MSDGSPLQRQDWNPHQPDNNDLGEDFAVLTAKSSGWNDIQGMTGDNKNAVACEKVAGKVSNISRVEESVCPVRQSSSGGATDNSPFLKDALSQTVKIDSMTSISDCQN